MTTSLPRRQFLKTAGGIAAGSALLHAATSATSAAADDPAPPPTPEDLILLPVLPFLPLFNIKTDYVDYPEFIVLGEVLEYNVGAGTVYPHATYTRFVAPLKAPVGSILQTVTVLVKGPSSITASLYAHDMTNGGFVGDAPIATKTGVPPASGKLEIDVPSNYKVVNDQRLQVYMNGADAGTPISGIKFTYTPKVEGYYPITPTRVYDSRDAGSGGPLSSGETRDVSLANATTFAGGTANVVPDGAYCVTYNLTLDGATTQGYLAIYPQGGTFKASAINWFTTGEVVANGGVVTMSDRTVTVAAGGGGATNFIIDITGYYI